MARKKYATLAKDYELKGYGVLRASEKYEVVVQNSRYTYLQIKQGLTARVANGTLTGYKSKAKKQKKSTGDADLDHLFGIV